MYFVTYFDGLLEMMQKSGLQGTVIVKTLYLEMVFHPLSAESNGDQ